MKTQSTDTNLKTERVLISFIRTKSPSKKLSQILSLSQTTMQLYKRAIARAHKQLNIDQIKLLFINYHYGENLAEQVKKYIDKGRNAKS